MISFRIFRYKCFHFFLSAVLCLAPNSVNAQDNQDKSYNLGQMDDPSCVKKVEKESESRALNNPFIGTQFRDQNAAPNQQTQVSPGRPGGDNSSTSSSGATNSSLGGRGELGSSSFNPGLSSNTNLPDISGGSASSSSSSSSTSGTSRTSSVPGTSRGSSVKIPTQSPAGVLNSSKLKNNLASFTGANLQDPGANFDPSQSVGTSPTNQASSNVSSNGGNNSSKSSADNSSRLKKQKAPGGDLFENSPQSKKGASGEILTNRKTPPKPNRMISNAVEPDPDLSKILLSLDGIYAEAGKWSYKQTVQSPMKDGGMRTAKLTDRQQKYWVYDDTYGGEVRLSQEVDKQGLVTGIKGIYRTNQAPSWKPFVYNRNPNSGRLENNTPLATRMLNNCRSCHEPADYKLLKKQ